MSGDANERCVVALPGSEACAGRLASAIGAELLHLEARRFPDGERYLCLRGDVRHRTVAVVAQLRDPDPQLPTLFFLADLLRDLGAERLELVAPYLPYMRQDKRFHAAEALTSASFARWVSRAFDRLVTVDPHLHRYRSLNDLYPIPTLALSSSEAVAAWIRDNVERPALVGADDESAIGIWALSQRVHCPCVVLHKVRHGDRQVSVELPDLTGVRGHTPVIVDDIVSSGHTMAEAIRALRRAGLPAPVCIAVHAVLDRQAAQLIEHAGAARFVTCNSLEASSNGIDLTAVLAEGVAGGKVGKPGRA